jgi:hypothetical protein
MLDYFNINNQNTNIIGSLSWNSKNDVVAFEPTDILPGESNFNISTKVHFEEKIGTIWQTVTNNGQPIQETKNSSFTTGIAPPYIPENNVSFSYPVNRQLNFYKNEVNYGFIQLKQGQDYLWDNTEEWVQKIRFKTLSDSIELNYSYNNETNRINFNTPTNLQNDKIYQILILNIPLVENNVIDHNVINITRSQSDTSGNNANIKDKEIDGNLAYMQEQKIYSYYFKSSKYNTFNDKMNALQISEPWSWAIYNGVHKIGVNITGAEYFDKFEIIGNTNILPLIQITTDNNNLWFNNYTNPLIYCPLVNQNCNSNYPTDVIINWRDTNPVGTPPVQTSSLYLYPNTNPELTEQNIENNSYTSNTSNASICNLMDFYQYKDYNNLVQQASAHQQKTVNQALINILNSTYPSMLAGYPSYYYYKIIVKYYIPGTNTPTSSKIINIGY